MFTCAIIVAALAFAAIAGAQDYRVDPTWLHRNIETAQERKSAITTPTCHYKPLFGEGDADRSVVAGIERYGEVTLDPHGSCSAIELPHDDEIYVVLQS